MIRDDDPTAQRLREAVWADPQADAPRMVFADYFLDAGDPLGELVALQLQRARTGDAITQREIELVVAHGRRAFEPIQLAVQRFQLERGFLAQAWPIGTMMTTEVAEHPAWSTMKRLTLIGGGIHPLWKSTQLRSLETLRTSDDGMRELWQRTEPLPITRLTSPVPHRGLAISDERGIFVHAGALDRVRAISLSAYHLERALTDVASVLESRLIRQLAHLDLTFTSIRLDDLRMWTRWFDTVALARFSVQVPLAQDDRPPGVVPGQQFATKPTRFLCVAIDRDDPTLTVQLDEPTEDRHVDDALRIINELGEHRPLLAISDAADPNRIETRHAALLARLRRVFAKVTVTTGPVRSLAP